MKRVFRNEGKDTEELEMYDRKIQVNEPIFCFFPQIIKKKLFFKF